MTGATGVNEVTGVTKVIGVTGVTKETGVTWVTGVSWVTNVTGLTSVTGLTGVTRMMGGHRGSANLYIGSKDTPDEAARARFYGMDEDGFGTIGLKLMEGSNFSGDFRLDSSSVIINETAASKLGDVAIGDFIDVFREEDHLRAKVIGVVQDFHYESFHDEIGPVVIGHYRNPFQGIDDIVIRFEAGPLSETLASVEVIHNRFDENDVMTWEFLDDMMQRAYERELIFRKIFGISSTLALVIAILGVIGMVAYNITNRKKEFGIRKVLGASFLDLIRAQGIDIFKYLGLSVLVALPVSWFLAARWLDDFAYRIGLGPWPFAIAVFFVGLVSASTILLLGFRSAAENPVKSLRYE